MYRSLRICSFALALAAVTGCGGSGSGPAEFDASAVTPVTAEQEKAALDYEAQMKKEHEEQYGN
jgi:predicted small lipoprotein YifL